MMIYKHGCVNESRVMMIGGEKGKGKGRREQLK
jgi:hypothetical protein